MDSSRNKFPKFYQNLIDNSFSLDKEFDIVGNFIYSKNSEFEKVYEPKKLVLLRENMYTY